MGLGLPLGAQMKGFSSGVGVRDFLEVAAEVKLPLHGLNHESLCFLLRTQMDLGHIDAFQTRKLQPGTGLFLQRLVSTILRSSLLMAAKPGFLR